MNELQNPSYYIKNRAYIVINVDTFKSNCILLDNNDEITSNDTDNKKNFISFIYKTPSISLEGLTLETPWMTIIKPIFQNNAFSLDKSFIELSFIGLENDNKLQQFLQCMLDIDRYLINSFSNINTYSNITSSSQQKNKNKRKNKSQQSASSLNNNFYITTIKQSNMLENNEQSYYHMKAKLNILKKHIEYNNKIIRNYKHFFNNVNISNSIAKLIIHCSGIWNYEGRYGLTWKILAINLHSNTNLDYYDTEVAVDEEENTYHLPNFESEIDPDMIDDMIV